MANRTACALLCPSIARIVPRLGHDRRGRCRLDLAGAAMKHPLVIRIAAIAAIAFALLFALQMIRGKVADRQATPQAVTNAFMLETSAPQVLAGPFLVLTCEGAAEACEPAYF